MSFGMQMLHPPPRPYFYGGVDDEGYEFATLLEQVNKKLMVSLRDGKTIIGYLRSVDQFSNLVLTSSVDRIHVGKSYGEVEAGLTVVRGDNLVLVGEVDEENEEKKNEGLQKVSGDEILSAQREQEELMEIREKKRMEAFKERGLQYIPHYNNDPAFRLGENQIN